MTAGRVDLRAQRTARQEAIGEKRLFAFDAMEFEGPPEMPLAFVDLIRVGQFTEAVRTIFGDQTDVFMNTVQPTLGDLMVIAEEYGASLPSSLTSAGT